MEDGENLQKVNKQKNTPSKILILQVVISTENSFYGEKLYSTIDNIEEIDTTCPSKILSLILSLFLLVCTCEQWNGKKVRMSKRLVLISVKRIDLDWLTV